MITYLLFGRLFDYLLFFVIRKVGLSSGFGIIVVLAESMFSEVLVVDVAHRGLPVGHDAVFHHSLHVGNRRLETYPD